ncbi:MAG: class I SAM-dependent methyltransferase [Candidatus Diapherotrites archaeon]
MGKKNCESQKPYWLDAHFAFNREGHTRIPPYSKSGMHDVLLYSRLIDLLPQDGISKAFEIGYGNNPIISFLPSGVEKFGIDMADIKPDGINVIRHNVEDGLPFQKGCFELVVACETIEHIYETGNFLRECNRVLRKGGTLVLSTPNIASLRNIARCIRGRQLKFMGYDVRSADGHIRCYTRGSLFRQLDECGFSVEKFTSTKMYLPLHFHIKPIGWLGTKLAPLLPRYGDSLIVRARKV